MLRPRISVITTTWNRERYLPRVYKSLLTQSYQEFEWIVADDCSEDETQDLVISLASTSPFPVVVLRASVHIGKARMDNEAVAAARGNLLVWCDSDDYFLPNALEALIAGWDSIPPENQENFIGISALCESSDSILNSHILGESPFDAKLIDLEYKHRVKDDGVLFLRAEILKSHKFPEVDFVVPESAVWSALGQWHIRSLPIVLKKVEYNAQHCISFAPGMKYNRGRAHAMAISVRHQRNNQSLLHKQLWRTITYFRYCIHGDIDIRTAFQLWGRNTPWLVAIGCMLPASLLVLKDRFQQKIVKTHLEFDRAAQSVHIKEYHPKTMQEDIEKSF